jgi:hypothetical protein
MGDGWAPTRVHGRVATVAALVVVSLLLLLPPVPAAAHPFGPPPTAWVTHEGDQVGVVWDAAYDDLLTIGEHLGLLREGTSDRFREAETQVAPARAEEEALEGSEALRRYVTERIAVYQDGARCEPRMAVDDLAGQGVRTVHRCPRPVDRVRLEITMLHDVNPAYRTFALAERETPGPLAIFSVEQPEHEVDLTELDAADTGGVSTAEQAVILAALLLVLLGATWGFRRLTRTSGGTAADEGAGDAEVTA